MKNLTKKQLIKSLNNFKDDDEILIFNHYEGCLEKLKIDIGQSTESGGAVLYFQEDEK